MVSRLKREEYQSGKNSGFSKESAKNGVNCDLEKPLQRS
jgi:hypothetical protein